MPTTPESRQACLLQALVKSGRRSVEHLLPTLPPEGATPSGLAYSPSGRVLALQRLHER